MQNHQTLSVALVQIAIFTQSLTLSSCVYSTMHLDAANKNPCSQQSMRAGQVLKLSENSLEQTKEIRATVQGFVYHEGAIVENASVLVISVEDTYPRLEFNGISDAQGFFQIQVDQPGEYQLSIYKPGFLPAFLYRVSISSDKTAFVRGCLKRNTRDAYRD